MSNQVLINDISAIRAVALAGEGVALLPIHLCREECAAGKRVRVLPQWQAIANPIHIVYPRQRYLPLKVCVFVDTAFEELGKCLEAA